MADLVWLHEEALRLTHPVFAAGGPDAACVFVWDAARLAESHVGLKRQLLTEPQCAIPRPTSVLRQTRIIKHDAKVRAHTV